MTKRGKLSEAFVEALAEEWRVHGADVLEKVREKSPERFAQLVADLVPKEMLIGETVPSEIEGMTSGEALAFFKAGLIELEAAHQEAEAARARRQRIADFSK
jgi:hypothetical protein